MPYFMWYHIILNGVIKRFHSNTDTDSSSSSGSSSSSSSSDSNSNDNNQSASINLCRHWPVGDLWPNRITISPWAEKVVHSRRWI